MNSVARLLITDLDNTLYDWVTYFATSFSAMTKALVQLLEVDEQIILDEFKVVHQRYGNSEQPFAVLELPSVRRRFGDVNRSQLVHKLDPALHAFNSARKKSLKLYDDVASTLLTLRSQGVTIVGHTEAIAVNAYYRLSKLQVVDCFQRLYTIEGHTEDHPIRERQEQLAPTHDLIRVVPITERKPNPHLLLDICQREGIPPQGAVYIGDSLTRDISMAKAAGVLSIWARYGTIDTGVLLRRRPHQLQLRKLPRKTLPSTLLTRSLSLLLLTSYLFQQHLGAHRGLCSCLRSSLGSSRSVSGLGQRLLRVHQVEFPGAVTAAPGALDLVGNYAVDGFEQDGRGGRKSLAASHHMRDDDQQQQDREHPAQHTSVARAAHGHLATRRMIVTRAIAAADGSRNTDVSVAMNIRSCFGVTASPPVQAQPGSSTPMEPTGLPPDMPTGHPRAAQDRM